MKTFTQSGSPLVQLLAVLIFLFCFGKLIAHPLENIEAICNPSITVSLGSDGTADILPEMIDAGSFSEGNYLIQLRSETGQTSKKLMIIR